MVNVHRIEPLTRAEGPGIRCCVWMQGCSRHCQGCFATATWSTHPRRLMSVDDIIRQAVSHPEVEGITILGGEPFQQPEALAELTAKASGCGLSTIVFTGYTYEELTAARNPSWDKALSHIDVLIDGPYIEAQRSFRRPLVGSDNQRFHFLTSRYRMDDFRRNTIEVRISPDGTARLNGMGDLRALQQRFLKTTTRKHQQQ